MKRVFRAFVAVAAVLIAGSASAATTYKCAMPNEPQYTLVVSVEGNKVLQYTDGVEVFMSPMADLVVNSETAIYSLWLDTGEDYSYIFMATVQYGKLLPSGVWWRWNNGNYEAQPWSEPFQCELVTK